MKVLVTGVCGFVGRHLASFVSDQGCEVFGIGLLSDPGLGEEVFDLGRLAGFSDLSVTDPDGLRETVAAWRPERVFHLAAQSSAGKSFDQPVETFETNVRGTLNLLEAVRTGSPRSTVILVGSSEVYGSSEEPLLKEEHPVRPLNPYAMTKACVEILGYQYFRSYGLKVVVSRSFGHTGPGHSPVFALPSFARQIALIEAGRREPVLKVGNLEVVRDYSDVRDVVRAYWLLCEKGRAGRVYNVCSGRGRKMSEIVEELCRRSRKPVKMEVDPARVRKVDIPRLVGDPSLIADHTGWRAGIPFGRTLEDLLGFWRNRAGTTAEGGVH